MPSIVVFVHGEEADLRFSDDAGSLPDLSEGHRGVDVEDMEAAAGLPSDGDRSVDGLVFDELVSCPEVGVHINPTLSLHLARALLDEVVRLGMHAEGDTETGGLGHRVEDRKSVV